MTTTIRRTAKSKDGINEELSGAFHRSVEEGEHRLNRSWPGLLATGAMGGLDVGLGVFGLLIVREATGSTLLAALAFTTGFVALVLANSELFTENFLVPVMAVTAGKASAGAVARLWGGTLGTNLVGGWVVMGVIIGGFPVVGPTAVELASEHLAPGIGWRSFASGIFAGMMMTLLTWMERGTPSVAGKVAAAISVGFLLAAGSMNHAIVSSLEMFGALQAGAPFGYLDWAGMFGWAVLANLIGGVGLVTALRLIQVGPAVRDA